MFRIPVTALAGSALIAAGLAAPTGATAGSAETDKILQTELEGETGREVNIVVFDVEPGWETARHFHPGHVFVYVTDGTLEVDVEGEERMTVSAGDAFYERPDKPMVARTASAEDGARFIVFQVGPTGEPIMVPQPE